MDRVSSHQHVYDKHNICCEHDYFIVHFVTSQKTTSQAVVVCWTACYSNWCGVQSEVTSVLLEGTRAGKASEGGSMKGTIAKRFEELDWDNNGKQHLDAFLLFTHASTCSCGPTKCTPFRPTSTKPLTSMFVESSMSRECSCCLTKYVFILCH